MEKLEFVIKGMSCATCALNIENVFKDNKEIKNYSVNFATESGYIEANEPKKVIDEINKILKKHGYELLTEEKNIQEIQLQEKVKKLTYLLPISLLVFLFMIYEILSMFLLSLPKVNISFAVMNGILLILSTVVLLSAGRPFLRGIERFVKGSSANMDTLIGVGTFTAYIYSTIVYINNIFSLGIPLGDGIFFDAVIVVIGFVYLGKYLEYKSKYKTGEAIKKLATLQAKTAILIKDNKQIEIEISEIKNGDILLIKPGSKIPVDGEVVKGTGVIDMSMLTGEPIPLDVEDGATVYEGTLNIQGTFRIKALKVGDETALANIIRIVKEAQNSKAEIQKTADKISTIFVPVILIIATITILTWSISAYIIKDFTLFPLAISSFVAVLVIACPCALGLATPTAIIVGVGKAAQNGILIKNAESIEKLNKVDTVIFDKTGTLTRGKPTVEKLKFFKKNPKYESIIYSLESQSQHPLGIAVVNYLKKKDAKNLDINDFKNIDGKGISGEINGGKYYIGKPKYIESLGIKIDKNDIAKAENQGKTVVLFTNEKELLASITLSDEVKEESKGVIDRLHSMGINTVMITGDNKYAAKHIAKQLGIDQYYFEVLPSEKASYVEKYQKEGSNVAMVGDGINDAPALALSDVSIAMATGTEIAMSTSDITLLSGDLNRIPVAFKISKATLRTIKQNLFWAFIYNIICIPIAAGVFYPVWGILLNPIFAGLAMALSSFSVVTNSLRLKLLKI
ncbi:MAG: heavy metal translocating P-type ATPase [Candidatus Dojkabacteria bacterium]|jgi:Cu2+-exporting ATPase/Cu+-exporting ATPase|nr:heavy metal translocating P-type ATPase [Candidatus Dojkabacteria bacterium]